MTRNSLWTAAIALAIIPVAAAPQRIQASTALLVGVAPGAAFEALPLCDSQEGASKVCRHERRGDTAWIEPRPDRPKFLAENPLVLIDPDGTVGTVDIVTRGTESQQEVWDRLTLLFGSKPAILKKTTVQNGFGGTFLKVEAQWNTPTGVVMYESPKDRLDRGEIQIFPAMRRAKR